MRREDLQRLLAELDARSASWTRRWNGRPTSTQARLLMTQPGVGPITSLAFVLTIGEVSRFQARQAGGQLSGADSARTQLGRQTAAGRDQQARQPLLRACCWSKRRRPSTGWMKDFASSINTLPPQGERRGQGGGGQADWQCDSTGCCGTNVVIRRSPVSRAARGAAWTAQAIRELIGRSRIQTGRCKRRRKVGALENGELFSTFAPARRLDVRMEESWPQFEAVSMVGGTNAPPRSDQRVMFPESWSSNLTLAETQRCEKHRTGHVCGPRMLHYRIKKRRMRNSATAAPTNRRKFRDLRAVFPRGFPRCCPLGRLAGKPQRVQNGALGMGLPQIGQWTDTLQMVAARMSSFKASNREKCTACRRAPRPSRRQRCRNSSLKSRAGR